MQSPCLSITSRKNAVRLAFLVSALYLVAFDVSEGGSEKGKAAYVLHVLRVERLLQGSVEIPSDGMGECHSSLSRRMYFACGYPLLFRCLLFDMLPVDDVPGNRTVYRDSSPVHIFASDSLYPHVDIGVLCRLCDGV